ncbi:MAG TPA: urease accessory protein UreD [Methylomirabilota bacterium]|nr:urease accessory protein UreD [Methylomirabilota bacterium]
MSFACTNSGEALLHVAKVAGNSTVVSAQARNPFRLLTPRARGETVWAYTSSFGGGMVAGDCTRLDVSVDAGARCFLSTQASTKIYRNPENLPCSHELLAKVGDDALLVLVPDPVQCFAESSYEQRQRFTLAPTANLLLVDWMSAGRAARGERWSFRRYVSRNEVERAGRKLLVDALLLDSSDGALDSRFRGGRFNGLATVALFGPKLAGHAQAILDWCSAQPISPKASLVFAASPLQEGALLRFAGTSVEEVGRAIHERLGFVRELLSDNPWERKW